MYPSWIKVGQKVKCIYFCQARNQVGIITAVNYSNFIVEFDNPYFNTLDYRKWRNSSSFEPIIPSTPEEIAKADKLRQEQEDKLQRQRHADKYL